MNSYIYNLYVSRVSREPLKYINQFIIIISDLWRIHRRKEFAMSFVKSIFDVSTVPGMIVDGVDKVVNIANLGVSVKTLKNTKEIKGELDTIKYTLRDTSSSCRRTAAGLDAAVNQFGAAAKSSKKKNEKKKSSKKEQTVAAAAPEKTEEKKDEKKSK